MVLDKVRNEIDKRLGDESESSDKDKADKKDSPPSKETIAPNMPDKGGEKKPDRDQNSPPSKETIAPNKPEKDQDVEFSGGGSDSASQSKNSEKQVEKNDSSSSKIKQFAENIRSQNKKFEDLKEKDINSIQKTRDALTKKLNEGVTNALENREQNLENKKQASQNIERIRQASEDTIFTNKEGEELTKDQALTKAKQDKKRIENVIGENEENVKELRKSNKKASLTKEERIQKKAEELEFSPDNDGATEAGTFVLDVTDRIPAYTDTLLSDRGGRFLGSLVPGTEKGPDDIVEERVASLQLKQDTQNPDINLADPSRLSSPATLFIGGGAGGAAFKGVGKGIGQVSTKGQKIWKVAGAATGGAATVKEGGKALTQLNEGKKTEAAATAIDFAAVSAGFAKGSKTASNRLASKTGNTKIDQTQVIKPGDPITGKGKFKAETNIIDTQIRNPLTRKGLRSPLNTVTRKQKVSGRFNVLNDQAQGTFKVKNPLGQDRSGSFESISVPKSKGRNSQGQRVEISGDVARQKTESRLFRNTEDQVADTKSIQTGRRDSSAEEVLASFDNIALNKDQNVRAVEILSVNRDGQSNFAETTTFVLGRSGSGSSRGAAGGGQGLTGSGSGSRSFSGSGSGSSTVQRLSFDRKPGSKIEGISNDVSGQIRNVANRQAKESVAGQRDSSITTFEGSAEASKGQMGRGSGQDVGTFTSNIETIGIETDQRQETRQTNSQESIEITKPDISQRTITLGSPDRVKDKTSELLGVSQGQTQGQRQKLLPGNTNKLNTRARTTPINKPNTKNGSILAPSLGTRQQTKQINPQKLGLNSKTRAANVSRPIQTLKQTAPVVLQAGISGGLNNSTNRSGSGNIPGGSQKSSLELDWVSSNFVEQKGETPTFDLSGEDNRSTFGGILAEEELNNNKTKELNKFGGKQNIW